MLFIEDTGTGRASLIWSVAALVARTGGSFADLRLQLPAALGREPGLEETLEACGIGRREVATAGSDDAAVGAWMMLSRLAGRLQEGVDIDLTA